MIVRRNIFEKYENVKINIPYLVGDRVLVKKGERVSNDQDIVVKKGSSIKHSFYLPDKLGTDISKIQECITCIDGELVNVGDTLAERVVANGLTVKRLVAPSQGVVDLERINQGFLDLLGEENDVVVRSNFNATVIDVSPVDGLVVSTDTLALDILAISNVAGNKESRVFGEFVVLGDGNDLLLEADLDSYRDKIVFVGKYLHSNLLQDLFEKGASFVLTCSMDYSHFRNQGLPLGVLEGFGEISSGKKFLSTISSMNGKFALIDYTEMQIFFLSKEVGRGQKSELFVKSAVGSVVISRSLCNYGMYGKVIDIEKESTYLVVEWESGQRSMVNIGNVEFVTI